MNGMDRMGIEDAEVHWNGLQWSHYTKALAFVVYQWRAVLCLVNAILWQDPLSE